MSSSNPPYPYYNGIPFNPSFFTSNTATATGLSESTANTLYLRKTVADTASAVETFNAGIKLNLPITPNYTYPISNSAYVGYIENLTFNWSQLSNATLASSSALPTGIYILTLCVLTTGTTAAAIGTNINTNTYIGPQIVGTFFIYQTSYIFIISSSSTSFQIKTKSTNNLSLFGTPECFITRLA